MPAAAVKKDAAGSEPHTHSCRHFYMQTRTRDSKAIGTLCYENGK